MNNNSQEKRMQRLFWTETLTAVIQRMKKECTPEEYARIMDTCNLADKKSAPYVELEGAANFAAMGGGYSEGGQ